MEKEIQYNCGRCKFTWKSSEAKKVHANRMNSEREVSDFAEGYTCPKCDSSDISGLDL